MVSFFSSFRFAGYRNLWITTVAVIGGVQMSMAGRALLADDLTNSAFFAGIVVMGFAPTLLLFSVVGGIVGDKFQNRRVIQSIQSGFLFLSSITTLLIYTGLINWQFLFISSLIQGALFSFQLPARQSFIPKLVPAETVGNGVALLAGGMSLVAVFSGAGVGFVYGRFGPGGVFLVITIVQLIAFLLSLKLPKTEVDSNVSSDYVSEIKNSYAYLKGNKAVLVILLSSMLISLMAMPIRLQLPIIARRLYGISPEEIGIMLTVAAVGAVIGTIIISPIKKGVIRLALFLGSAFGLAFSILLMGALPIYFVGLIFVLFLGAFEQIRMAMSNVLTIEYTDQKFRARMMGFYMLNFAFIPLGALPIGFSIDEFGVTPTLIIDAILLIIALVIFMILSKSIRNLR